MRRLLFCVLAMAASAASGFGPAVLTPDGNTDWTVVGGSVAPVDSPAGWNTDTLLTQPDDKESRDPSAAIDARGRFHVAWKDNRRLRSHDEIHYLMKDSTGWHFECISNLDTAHNSPALVVDADNNVHVFFLRWSGQPYSYDIGYRRRDGVTGEWGVEERLTYHDSLAGTGRPYAVVIGDTVFVFWCNTNVSPQLFGYIYNSGSGWSDYNVVSTGVERYRGNFALSTSQDGWIHVAWEDGRADSTQLWHRYHDGDTWSSPYRTTFHGYNAVLPGVALDSAGNLHLTYSGGTDPTGRVHYRIWDRATRTWGPMTRWYSGNLTPDPRIGISLSTGERHMTYVDRDGTIYGLYYRRFDPGRGVWTDSTRLTFNGAKTGPAHPCLDAEGYVHLAFWSNGYYGSEEEILYKTNRVPVGVHEPGTVISRPVPATTIVRGTLYLPQISGRKPQSAGLLDISGRKVMDLQPGANDISHLVPGVHFVLQASGVLRDASSVTKVIVSR